MIASSKPKVQRRFRDNAPMHVKQKFAHAHIDKALAKKLKIKRRSMQLSKGDTVKVVRGQKKGSNGKVTKVDLRKGFIYVDGLTKKNARGKEFNIPIKVNNVYITDLNLSDKIRAAKLNMKPVIPDAKEIKEDKQVIDAEASRTE